MRGQSMRIRMSFPMFLVCKHESVTNFAEEIICYVRFLAFWGSLAKACDMDAYRAMLECSSEGEALEDCYSEVPSEPETVPGLLDSVKIPAPTTVQATQLKFWISKQHPPLLKTKCHVMFCTFSSPPSDCTRCSFQPTQDSQQFNLPPKSRQVATPCRKQVEGVVADVLGEIPKLDDNTVAYPTPGKLRLSEDAINARMRRVFQPNVKGEFKVSAEIIAQWKCKKKGRKTLSQLFQSVGFCTATWLLFLLIWLCLKSKLRRF